MEEPRGICFFWQYPNECAGTLAVICPLWTGTDSRHCHMQLNSLAAMVIMRSQKSRDQEPLKQSENSEENGQAGQKHAREEWPDSNLWRLFMKHIVPRNKMRPPTRMLINTLWFLKKFYECMPACMSVHHVGAWCLQRSEDGIRYCYRRVWAHHVGVMSWTWILWNPELLTTEPSSLKLRECTLIIKNQRPSTIHKENLISPESVDSWSLLLSFS